MSELKEEFPLVAGPKVTKLVTTYDPAHDNVIVVESIDSIPKPPNHVTIFDLDEHYTTVSYEFVGNNKLSGLKVIEGEEKHVYKIGDYVVRTIDKYDFDAIIGHIKYLESHKLDRFQGKCKSGQIMAVDGDGFVKPQEIESISSKWGDITGNINRQEDLMDKFDEKVDIKQGASYRGNVLRVNDYGNVTPDRVKWGDIDGSIVSQTDLVYQLNLKQDILESGVNIKTINDKTILGKGNIEIDTGSWGEIKGDITEQTDLVEKLDEKVSVVDDTTEYEQLYGKRTTGVQKMYDMTSEPIEETVVKRGYEGEIKVKEYPVNTTDAASKAYVDRKVSIAQGVEHYGKVLSVGEDGNVTLTDISGGTRDYELLINKPKINGFELIGDKALDTLGICKNDFGTEEAGKVLMVGPNGLVKTSAEVPGSGKWGGITGDINAQTDLMGELDGKVKIAQGVEYAERPLIVNTQGNVIPGSAYANPHMEGETAVFPVGSHITVVDTTVIF